MQKLALQREKGTEIPENGVEGNFIVPGGWAGSHVAGGWFHRSPGFFCFGCGGKTI